ncbi:MAG: ATP-grasp domain-containing protein [Mycobacterium sp.]|nr:ATP-grasp domain-containing protein [Mycobacterium sp.]
MNTQGFDTVLVANRGEIAVRVIRTCRALGIRTVAVFSDADAGARHVADADVAVRIGPPPARESYLNIDAVVDAALRTGAQAVHPGYGFLSENAGFADALQRAGLVFVGPPAAAIATMGDKIAARAAVSKFGVPVVPGVSQAGMTDAELIAAAGEIGFPVLVKPSAGGGGKGMRRVDDPAGLAAALAASRREAGAAFGDDTLFLERFVLAPRHIEVQVIADSHGCVLHLGERECSLQRRHQKVIEEAPSPLLDERTRARIGEAACETARSVDYVGAGTVEFIVSADRPDEFFFMEMNTRLQVEHPVTEMVTGWDLVEWQLRVAAGERLHHSQSDIVLRGHAIEARVYAEDPAAGFLPTGGEVLVLEEPVGSGVRVDSGLTVGTAVGSDYDPMLAKVVAHAGDRTAALRALDTALAATTVLGVGTNLDFLRFVLADGDVAAGRLDTGLLEQLEFSPDDGDEDFLAAAAYRWLQRWPLGPADPWDSPSGWRVGQPAPTGIRLSGRTRVEQVHIVGTPARAWVWIGDSDRRPLTATVDGHHLTVTVDGIRRTYRAARSGHRIWLAGEGRTVALDEVPEKAVRVTDVHSGDAELISPMPGSVVAVGVGDGEQVEADAVVVAVEAMKMEHALRSPVAGVVELLVAVGDQVTVGQPLARITAREESTEQ